MIKLCSNCHWNYNGDGMCQQCYPYVGRCTDYSKWMRYDPQPQLVVEGTPTSRYDIHVSGLSTVGEELKFELPTIGEE